MCSALHNIFLGSEIFSQFQLCLSFRSQVFYGMDLFFMKNK